MEYETLRSLTNKPGVSFDAGKTTVLFAEDYAQIKNNFEDINSRVGFFENPQISILAPVAPTDVNVSIVYNSVISTYYADSNDVRKFRIYSYKRVGSQKLLSADYLETDDIVTNPTYDGNAIPTEFRMSFTPATGADGYLVFAYSTFFGFNYDYYYDFNTPPNVGNQFIEYGNYGMYRYGSPSDFQQGGSADAVTFGIEEDGSAFFAQGLLKFTASGGIATGYTGEYISETFGVPFVIASPFNQINSNYGEFHNIAFFGADSGFGSLGVVMGVNDDQSAVYMVGTRIGASGAYMFLAPEGGYGVAIGSRETDLIPYGGLYVEGNVSTGSAFVADGQTGFTGSGRYTSFEIVGGIIVNAS